MSSSDLAVIIPTRERWEQLGITLAALREQTAPGFETILVIDGRDQDLPSIPGARVLRQDQAGPGVARNRGVNATSRRLILFLNDDMVPTPDLVSTHLALHQEEPADEVAVLGHVTWHPAIPRDGLHRWLEWSGALFDFPVESFSQPRNAGWERFYSCNVSLKRDFFVAAGGFDSDFAFDYEDLDLGWRLGQRGLRLLYEPEALVHHLHRYDWASLKRRYASRAVAERLMMAKHDWFVPWFYNQLTSAEREPAASPLWAVAARFVPRRAEAIRSKVQKRADRHYRQQLAPVFLSAWNASGSQDVKPGRGRRLASRARSRD